MIALSKAPSDRKRRTKSHSTSYWPGLTIIFLLAVVTLQPFRHLLRLTADSVCFSVPARLSNSHDDWWIAVRFGIAGMDRLVQHNVLAMSGEPWKPQAMSTRSFWTRLEHHSWKSPSFSLCAGSRRDGAGTGGCSPAFVARR